MLTYDLQFLGCLPIPKLCQFDIESYGTALKVEDAGPPVAEQCSTNISPDAALEL